MDEYTKSNQDWWNEAAQVHAEDKISKIEEVFLIALCYTPQGATFAECKECF